MDAELWLLSVLFRGVWESFGFYKRVTTHSLFGHLHSPFYIEDASYKVSTSCRTAPD